MAIDYASTRSASKGVTSHGFDSAVRDCPPFPLSPVCMGVRPKKKKKVEGLNTLKTCKSYFVSFYLIFTLARLRTIFEEFEAN